MRTCSILAHRGMSREAPENTLASFRKAVEHGLDIELDLDLTRDERLIVMHDRAVDRTTDGEGAIANLTLAELKKLDAGSWFGPAFRGERIPTFDEVLDLVRGKALLGIDFKKTLAGREETLVDALRGCEYVDRVFVFDQPPESSRRIKELCPAIPVAARANGRGVSEPFHEYTVKLFPEADVVWAADTLEKDTEAPALDYYITPDMVEKSHAHGKRIFAAVVDNPERWRALIAMGIDGICTRRPAALKDALHARD